METLHFLDTYDKMRHFFSFESLAEFMQLNFQ